MKKSPSLIYLVRKTMILALLLPIFSVSLSGANLVVQVGEKIQDKVATASVGDVVIIRGGTFPEQDINISKPIRMVREKGTTVNIGGTITLDNVQGDIVLRDFPINVNNNGKLIIQNCSKVGLEDLSLIPQGVQIINSTVIIRSCQFSNSLTISGDSDVQLIDSNLKNVTTTGSKVQVIDTVLLALNSTDSNLTIARSTHTTGTITRGQTLYHGSTASGDVTINASDWRAHGSTFKGNLTSTNAHSNLLRSTVEKGFTHNGASKDCVVFQSTVGRNNSGNSELFSDANRTWVTYSTFHHAWQYGGKEAHFVLNNILTDHKKAMLPLILGGSDCKYYINNNYFFNNGADRGNQTNQIGPITNNTWKLIKTLRGGIITKVTNRIHIGGDYYSSDRSTHCKARFFYTDGTSNDVQKTRKNSKYSNGQGWGDQTYNNPHPSKVVTKIEIHLYSQDNGHEKDTTVYDATSSGEILVGDSKKVSIHNNWFRRPNEYSHCIFIDQVPDDGLTIHGNVFWRDSGTWRAHAVFAPAGGECSHNYFHHSTYSVTGGIANFDNLVGADPKIDTSTWLLKEGSPLIDAGPEEPHFKDHDGSRNDIGMFGGHAYDPAGKTSTNPVVLSGTQNIVRMNVGDTTPLIIKSRGAVSTSN